jgi:hypothetical protein
MPHFLLTFGDASRPPGAAVIIEAPSMFQARMTAVVPRLAPGVPFGEGLKLSAEMIMATPPEDIGRMMSGVETAELIRRVVQGRGRPWPSQGGPAVGTFTPTSRLRCAHGDPPRSMARRTWI